MNGILIQVTKSTSGCKSSNAPWVHFKSAIKNCSQKEGILSFLNGNITRKVLFKEPTYSSVSMNYINRRVFSHIDYAKEVIRILYPNLEAEPLTLKQRLKLATILVEGPKENRLKEYEALLDTLTTNPNIRLTNLELSAHLFLDYGMNCSTQDIKRFMNFLIQVLPEIGTGIKELMDATRSLGYYRCYYLHT